MLTSIRKLSRFASTPKDDPRMPERKRGNSKLEIDRLPPKVLSRIMLIGVQSDQRVWRWGPRSIGSQQIASHVCRHWRNIALNTPSLWTFVHTGPTIPSDHTALYLSRAGSIDPLDIALDLSSPFHIYDPADSENHDRVLFDKQGDSCDLSKNLSGILNLLNTHGAEASRWRSLLVRTEELGGRELSSLIECIGQHPVPNLQRLHLGHYRTTFTRMLLDDDIDYSTGQISEGTRAFLESLSSNLLCLELKISYPYTFGSTWAFTKLKTLTIVSYKLGYFHLADLLLANPQLEYLCLNRPIVAPSLRSLSIHTPNRADRARQIIAAIEATGLHTFALKCAPKRPEGLRSLVAYIIAGRGPADHTGSGGRPIFPSLQSLDLSRFLCTREQTKDLVSSFPELTRLVVREQQLLWLNETPLKLSRLKTLGVLGSPARAAAVMNSPSHRGFASSPIKDVEAKGGRLKLSTAQHKIFGLVLSRSFVAPEYEYYRYEDDIMVGDLQSLETRSASNHTLALSRCSSIEGLDHWELGC
ncbi:hypothetical protein RSAG8_03212, partial [Rhizoctonia solani AG-8 WAC10335]